MYTHTSDISFMVSSLDLLLLCFSFPWLLFFFTSANQIPKHYVVYMGGPSNIQNGIEEIMEEAAHLQLLSSIIPRGEGGRVSLTHHYHHVFKGFSAMLTEDEASLLSGNEEIVSVFADPILQLHTTRSWDFLQESSGMRSTYTDKPLSSDVIVGIIDTGIWPESRSFNDEGIGNIPSRWKGICMEGPDFRTVNCNRKLIGARHYNIPMASTTFTTSSGSPRDHIGHGTHTSSIACGSHVANASYYGLAKGTARGGSPSSRLAIYKACSQEGCHGSTILKAIDDAVHDGVDIISISIGASSIYQFDFLSDPLAIGAFHAQKMGVLVICSAGNDGPDVSTVVNTAPWILTVAASTIDREFQSDIILGNGRTFQGLGVNLSNLTRLEQYPLVFGKEVAAEFTPEEEARNCRPGSLDLKKLKGKIVVCIDNDQTITRKIKKLVVQDGGAKGMILITEDAKGVPFDSALFPYAQVGITPGYKILSYYLNTKNPTATILASVTVEKTRPAPVVAYFSSRGPGIFTQNILKPDVMAPGVGILGAIVPKDEEGNVFGSGYAIKSGTSMACPHVTGAAALLKSHHPNWTPSSIKSALMTTATSYDNMRKPLKSSSGHLANPHEMGAGEIHPHKALNPGLVFDTTTQDYLRFLCYYGYSQRTIRSISKTNFNCSKNSKDLISNINYPSISIAKLVCHQASRTVHRVVTNVGLPNTTYISQIEAPKGLVVKVIPEEIVFSKRVRKVSFQVLFQCKEATSGYNYGSITFSDGQHIVRIVFTVNVE